jgi:predicted nuclease of predicted toxin-antitoxin system
MKLLIDENVSFRIVKQLNELFPDSVHVTDVVPPLKNDFSIYQYAKDNNFTIVTFDEDFIEIQALKGFPPKIIWLRMGNSSTLNILHKLSINVQSIKDLSNNTQLSILEIH